MLEVVGIGLENRFLRLAGRVRNPPLRTLCDPGDGPNLL